MEGHTDSKPFGGGRDGYSNWELSTDRANAARRWMQSHGMRDDQVSQVRGFADQSPRDPSTPGAVSNRRITLIIQYQKATAADLVKPAGPGDRTPNRRPPPKAPDKKPEKT